MEPEKLQGKLKFEELKGRKYVRFQRAFRHPPAVDVQIEGFGSVRPMRITSRGFWINRDASWFAQGAVAVKKARSGSAPVAAHVSWIAEGDLDPVPGWVKVAGAAIALVGGIFGMYQTAVALGWLPNVRIGG
jgi:hypothetical protein